MAPEDFRALLVLICHHINPYGVFELELHERLPIEWQAAAWVGEELKHSAQQAKCKKLGCPADGRA